MTAQMPAEWQPHEATWLAWPHEESDWPGKLPEVEQRYVEMVSLLGKGELVQILCHDEALMERAERLLQKAEVHRDYQLHLAPNDRGWLRDTLPTAVTFDGKRKWLRWKFNGWARYDNYQLDRKLPEALQSILGEELIEVSRPDTGEALVMEGGAFDTNGKGLVLVTEECLLSEVQMRNPGLSKAGYEEVLSKSLGAEEIIWLAGGIAGDDTHGHVDDVARFVREDLIVLAYENDEHDINHAVSLENAKRLEAENNQIEVVRLPLPRAIYFEGERLPASYANFYIANDIVLVPVFSDPADKEALAILSELFPKRDVLGLDSRDLILGRGSIHCLTQQQPNF